MKNGWCRFGVNNVDTCSIRTLQRLCLRKDSRNRWVGDGNHEEYLRNYPPSMQSKNKSGRCV